jgi:hypothetical protein
MEGCVPSLFARASYSTSVALMASEQSAHGAPVPFRAMIVLLGGNSNPLVSMVRWTRVDEDQARFPTV